MCNYVNTCVLYPHNNATKLVCIHVYTCWKNGPKIYIRVQEKKLILMVGSMFSQKLVAHNQMQLVKKNIACIVMGTNK
jgi:hypothetical protein